MVQTIISFGIPAWGQRLVFEKPHSLRRIFCEIRVLGDEAWTQSRVSFDDPRFMSYYILSDWYKQFEIKGDGISQGDIWLRNPSEKVRYYTATEILV